MVFFNLLIGLGIFLFGMVQLERSIESLSSNWIKQWLAKSTHHPISSIFAGTTVTAFVQSSSMVSLIVLAFASASMIPLYNAIGVLLGANLGTTFTGWVVATLGFKLNLSAAALPAIGLGCLIQVFGESKPKINASGALIFGFGLLLFGLDLMKDAVTGLPQQLDLDQLKEFNAVSFLLLGIAMTAVIQSSSATIMIALTALNSQIIDLPGAAALIIGADLGTTSTTILGSIKGSAIKRQLALAQFIFNLVVDLLAFILLLPLLPQLLSLISIDDPLYSLVAFHSLFNLLGLCLFVPFLKYFSVWIEKRFVGEKSGSDTLLNVPVTVPEAAINACSHQVSNILIPALSINARNLKLDQLININSVSLNNASVKGKNFEQRYESLKQAEGDLLNYSTMLQQQTLTPEQIYQLNQLIDCARDAVYAVKNLKDVRPNLIEMRHSLTPPLMNFSQQYQQELKDFYQILFELITNKHTREYINEVLHQLEQNNDQLHQKIHDHIQSQSGQGSIEPEQLSTLFNVNREIWHSGKNILKAFHHWYNAAENH